MYVMRGMTAGSVVATIELRDLLIKSVDIVLYCFRLVTAIVYIDDTSLEGSSPPRILVPEIARAIKCLADELAHIGSAQLRSCAVPPEPCLVVLCVRSCLALTPNKSPRLNSLAQPFLLTVGATVPF